MSHSLLLMVTLVVLAVLPRASPHPLGADFQHASRYGQVDDTTSKATQNDNTVHQGDIAQHNSSRVPRKLWMDNWRRLHNILRGVYGLAKHTTKWQRSNDDGDEGIIRFANPAPMMDSETGAPDSGSIIPPTVRSTRGAADHARQSTPMTAANKRSGPLEFHMIPPEVVQYVLQGWRDHSARQEALEAALEQAGMRLPAGWRGRDDLSVGLDVEVLKIITADMNRLLQKDHQMSAQNKLARIG